MPTNSALTSSKATPEVFLKTLGPAALVVGSRSDASRELHPGGKALALLAFLARAPGRSEHRERLVALLWANADEESGLQSLRQVRHALRQLLGFELVGSDRGRLVLAPVLRCDLDEFAAAVAAQDLDRAIALYRGAFFERFAAPGAGDFERWASAQRAAHALQALECLDRRATELLALARARDALALADRLQAIDPEDERHWRIRLEALLLKGDPFGALTVAKQCERWFLDEEVALPRSLTTLLARAKSANASTPPGAETDGPSLAPELIGREAEFAALIAAAKRATVGRGVGIVVRGAAGMGKSRLLHDVAERLAATRTRVVEVRALPADRPLRFALIARLIAALVRLRGAAGLSPASASVLLSVNPTISSAFANLSAAVLSSDQHVAILEAVDDLLGVLAEEAPLAVMVDDLHWADADSVRVLSSLSERQSTRRVLLVLASRVRSDGVAAFGTDSTLLQLATLTQAQTLAMLDSIAEPAATDDGAWRLAIFAATSGVPLLVLEAVRLAMDAGALAIVGGRWCVRDAQQLRTMLAHRSVVADRLRRLDARAHRVLMLLAVAGLPLPEESMRRADASLAAEVGERLRELELRDVAVHTREGWMVAHDALADSVLETATDAEFRAAQSALAEVLRVGETDAQQSRALELCGALERWSDAAGCVMRMVERQSPNPAARRTLALAILDRLDAPDARRRVWERLPWRLRVRGSRIAMVGLIALLSVILASGFAYRVSRGAAPEDDGTRLVVLVTDSLGRQEALEALVTARGWSAGHAVDARAVRGPIAHALRAGGERPERLFGSLLLQEHYYPDSGGVDIALVRADSSRERLTNVPGDDVPSGWAPDGSAFLFTSSRAGVRGHRAVWAMQLATRTARRISSGGTLRDSDDYAVWSPDGSRVVFMRRYFDLRHPEICTVDSDGARERCMGIPGRAIADFGGWLDVDRFVVVTDSMLDIRTVVVHTERGTWEDLRAARGACLVSPNGQWFACRNHRQGEVTVASVAAPEHLRRVTVPASSNVMGLLWSYEPSRIRPVARIEVRVPRSPVPTGVGTLLTALAKDADGMPIAGVPLRWRTPDSALASVSADGLLVPRRAGIVRVEVSAGGWRSTTVRLQADELPSRVLLRESWESDAESRWRYFGTPRPTAMRTDGSPGAIQGASRGARAVFWNRGDGDHYSGAYSRQLFSGSEGLWIEAEVSTKLTATQWQGLTLMIREVGDRAAAERWDHVDGPIAGGGAHFCDFNYPASEGLVHLSRLGGVELSQVPALRSALPLYSGAWYRVLVHLFPDGRCGLAVNGVPVRVTRRTTTSKDSLTVYVYGNSNETRVLVGTLVVGKGIRTDVRWEQAPSEIDR